MTLIARAALRNEDTCLIRIFDADNRPLRSAMLPHGNVDEAHVAACWMALLWAREAAKNMSGKLQVDIITSALASEAMEQQMRWAERNCIELLFICSSVVNRLPPEQRRLIL